MADGGTTWDDVLTPPAPGVNATAPPPPFPGATAPRQAQRGNMVGWDDLLTQPAPKPARPPAQAPSLFNRTVQGAKALIAGPQAEQPEEVTPPPFSDENYPTLTKATGALDKYVAQPVIRTRNAINQSLADIPKVFSEPVEVPQGVTGTHEALYRANEGVRRVGRLASNVLAPGMAPFSVATAPLEPAVQPYAAAAGNILNATAGGQVRPELENPAEGAAHRLSRVLQTPGAVRQENPNAQAIYGEIGAQLPFAAFGGAEAVRRGAVKPTIEAAVEHGRQLGFEPAPAGPGDLTPQGADIMGRLPTRMPATERMAEQQYQRATGRAQERSVIEPKNPPIIEGAQSPYSPIVDAETRARIGFEREADLERAAKNPPPFTVNDRMAGLRQAAEQPAAGTWESILAQPERSRHSQP